MASIETRNLKLRQWCDDDYEPVAAFYADEKNTRYVGGQKNADEAWRHLALLIGHWQLKAFGYWAVDEKATGKFAGCVGLWKSPRWPELELGCWIVNEHQGKGYAFEAGVRETTHSDPRLLLFLIRLTGTQRPG